MLTEFAFLFDLKDIHVYRKSLGKTLPECKSLETSRARSEGLLKIWCESVDNHSTKSVTGLKIGD